MNKKIYLIRHGKTEGNIQKRYIGITDESLSEAGKNEISSFHYPSAEIVFVSPMKRCIETAKIIYPSQKVTIIDELKETDFGDFEGKNYEELKSVPEYIRWMESGGKTAFPNGENPADVTARVMKGFKKLLSFSSGNSSIAAIVHGGTIMSILSELFGGNYYDYIVENGKGYSFDISSDGIYSGLSSGSFDR